VKHMPFARLDTIMRTLLPEGQEIYSVDTVGLYSDLRPSCRGLPRDAGKRCLPGYLLPRARQMFSCESESQAQNVRDILSVIVGRAKTPVVLSL